eukprot:3187311-Prymnesium_polylepis.1
MAPSSISVSASTDCSGTWPRVPSPSPLRIIASVERARSPRQPTPFSPQRSTHTPSARSHSPPPSL